MHDAPESQNDPLKFSRALPGHLPMLVKAAPDLRDRQLVGIWRRTFRDAPALKPPDHPTLAIILSRFGVENGKLSVAREGTARDQGP